MFWRSEKHKFGWYVEPTYEYNFGRGREQSLGFTAGLLISLPWHLLVAQIYESQVIKCRYPSLR